MPCDTEAQTEEVTCQPRNAKEYQDPAERAGEGGFPSAGLRGSRALSSLRFWTSSPQNPKRIRFCC